MTSIMDRVVEMTPGGRIPIKLQLAAFAVVLVVMLLACVASAAAQGSDRQLTAHEKAILERLFSELNKPLPVTDPVAYPPASES